MGTPRAGLDVARRRRIRVGDESSWRQTCAENAILIVAKAIRLELAEFRPRRALTPLTARLAREFHHRLTGLNTPEIPLGLEGQVEATCIRISHICWWVRAPGSWIDLTLLLGAGDILQGKRSAQSSQQK